MYLFDCFFFIKISRFITGPPDIKDDQNIGKIPRVYLNTSEENEECYLLVYRAHNASVCMLINGKFVYSLKYFETFVN